METNPSTPNPKDSPVINPKELELRENEERLYKSCLDIVDTLLTKTPEPEHATIFTGIMREFCAGQLVSRVYPKERGWDPRHDWKTGEHSGFVVQMRNEKKQVLYINIYGGLRVADKVYDLRDGDIHNTRIHNNRTDSVLCNATEVVFKLLDNSGDIQTEVKFFRDPDQRFFLRSIQIKINGDKPDKRYYVHRKFVYEPQDYHYAQVSQAFSGSCNYFIGSVESFLKN